MSELPNIKTIGIAYPQIYACELPTSMKHGASPHVRYAAFLGFEVSNA